jgi:hypothetical protein
MANTPFEMSSIQRFFTAILPASWARSMEAESRAWMVRCPCGFERSVWDMGGIRWKAAGQPRKNMRCQSCGQITWHKIDRQDA